MGKSNAVPSSNRPNVLLVMCDQFRGDCLGIDGHPDVKTPYLDTLAADGVLFENAYSACPSCIPARAGLFTGKTPRTMAVWDTKTVSIGITTICWPRRCATADTRPRWWARCTCIRLVWVAALSTCACTTATWALPAKANLPQLDAPDGER